MKATFLIFAVVLVGGCASPADKALKKPISPVDLIGPNKSLAIGTVVTLREKGDSVATVSVSGKGRSTRGGGTVKGELSTRLEVLEIKDGRVSKVKISDGSGKIEIISWQNSQKSNTTESHSLAGRALTLDFISGKFRMPASLNKKQKTALIFAATGINDHALYPLNPVKVGHQWELSPAQISRLLEAVSVASDVSDHMRKFAFTGKISFVGVKNYQNQQSAVLRLTLDGSGQVQGAAARLKVSGTILRSLQHHRNLQQNLEMKMDGSGETSGIVFKHSSSKKSTVNYQFEIPASPKATLAKPQLIADPLVEKAIRKDLKKPTGELTKADLEKLKRLNLWNKKLTDVKGLEKLTQLTVLSLWSNQLTDVKGLEKLTQLTFLELITNPDLTKAQIDALKKALPKCKITSSPKK